MSAVQAAAALSAAYAVFVVGRLLAKREPGDRLIAINAGPLSMPISGIWPPKGWLGNYWAHFLPYDRIGQTVIPCIFPLTAERYMYVGDAAACKMIMNDRHAFIKNVKAYALISFFGENIVGTEGDTWVRHRSIARKSFGERNNALLWTETVRTLEDWFAPWDAEIGAQGGKITANVTESMRDITLFVIASAGFGLQFSRTTLGEKREGYALPFGEALFTAIETMFHRVLAPRWLYSLPIETLKKSDEAYGELQRYIKQMIAEARASGAAPGADAESSEAADLFRRLVDANDEEQGARLTDDELLSNIYVFFLAGHETSAHTLTFAFALLALHPEVQDKLYEEAKRLWPEDSGEQWSTSKLPDYNRLEYALAVFRETLRLFPAEVAIQRMSVNDTTLPSQIRNAAGQRKPARLPVKAGTVCVVDIHAVHMSPLYWGEDSELFRPERFIDSAGYEWPRDAWIPFTGGPHVCLGQRFATVESVCILARMARKYRISPTPEIAKLPKDEQWRRLTKWTVGVTSTPGRVDLLFEKR
ncbi:cytochrome P450 [Exidia glandulosa HHB12029]|uniref:Cytochrome P450 n=1 Tax=Exidia glandulosa HHB12029 TaxID=1314781 RepID=A0A165HPC5_EXIGL|nr:cytochrome P450 [Exidia glandulosa HHB12029]